MRGDRVEFVGPADEELDAVEPGDVGTVIDEEEPGSWVVDWDRVGAEVCPADLLHKLNPTDEARL